MSCIYCLLPVAMYTRLYVSVFQVKIYTCINNELSKGLSKFSKTAFGGKFRKDSRLLCAGSEDTSVRVFDVNNKHLLRQFKGHERSVLNCYI